MELLIDWSALIGGAAFALSGFLLSVRKHLDIMGVFIIAFITANGGGIIRDVLIGVTPRVLMDLTAFIIVLSVFILGCLLHYLKNIDIEKQRFFILSDTLGLVAFSISGALIGLEHSLSFFGVIFLAFVTAVGGGIIRDILLNDVPIIFKSGFYGSVAILIGVSVWGLSEFDEINKITLSCVFILGLFIRLIAYRYRWRLPVLK